MLPQALGLNTTQFNRHVILETNNATARIFPEVGRRGSWLGSCAGGQLRWLAAAQHSTRPVPGCAATGPLTAPLLPLPPWLPFSLQVPDVEAPGFWPAMDRMVEYNNKIVEIGNSDGEPRRPTGQQFCSAVTASRQACASSLSPATTACFTP